MQDKREIAANKPADPVGGRQEEQRSANKLLEFLLKIHRGVAWYWETLKGKGKSDRMIAVATFVIAIAGGATWWEAYNAGDQTDKIIAADQRIATAMESTVRQAGKALNASIDASRIDQRAWASVKEIKLAKPVVLRQPIQISMTAINTGKTPVLDIVLSEVRIGPSETDRDRDLVVHQDDREVIAPNNTDTFFATAAYDDESIRAILAGAIRIYVRGRFEYKDVFGATHATTFCAYYPANGPPTATGYFFNCKAGNSMD